MHRRLIFLWLCSTAAFVYPTAVPASEHSGAPAAASIDGAVAPVARRAGGPVRLVPTGRAPLRVLGLHSYFGPLVVKPDPGGLVLVNRISLEKYLLGLDEVPRTWPAEALKAQAVAARTYALWTLDHSAAGASAQFGFDICASTECQVFSGADVVTAPDGLPWVQAVEETAGESVLYDGRPILARYHSTSGGRTFSNERGFPGEPGYPYLQGVPSRTESGSSLYRWEVLIPLRHVETMVRKAGWWKGSFGALVRVAAEPDPPLFNPAIEFTGKRGEVVRSADDFRAVAADLAPKLWPTFYPSPADTTSGRLPETLPSERYTVQTRSGVALFEGRGWGHGVGLSQWGAHGLAMGGSTYRDILSHYYPGTSIGTTDTTRPIRVGLDWGRRTVTVEGDFDVVDGRGRKIGSSAGRRWTFRNEAASLSMRTGGRAAFGRRLRARHDRRRVDDARETVAPDAGSSRGPVSGITFLLGAAGVAATGAVALWAVRMRR